jgi:hypothetical protein
MTAAGPVSWQSDQNGWHAIGGTPPACPAPLVLTTPVEVGLVYSVLYPGQLRGGDYKPHGGFRFDGQPNDAPDVRVPITGVAVDGGRYLEGGVVQHLVDIIAPCGIMVRFDHLLVLAGPLANAFDTFPAPVEGDSRTSSFSPPIALQEGDVIATAVGTPNGPNVFVDFGVYDLRQPNAASADPAWTALHGSSLASYAVCWFDLLPPTTAATIRGLPPADGVSGSSSDYCTP